MQSYSMIDPDDWERLTPAIEATLARAGGTFTPDDVRAAIDDGRFGWWPGEKSYFVTEIVDYPQFRTVRIIFAGGDLGELLSREPEITSYARDVGASKLEVVGRPGWGRIFPNAQFYGAWLMQEI